MVKIGGGKIFVHAVDKAMRIRARELNEAALRAAFRNL